MGKHEPFKSVAKAEEASQKNRLNKTQKYLARVLQKDLIDKDFISINDDHVMRKIEVISRELDINSDDKTKLLLKRYISSIRGKLNEQSIMKKVNLEKNLNFVHVKDKQTVEYGLFKMVGIPDAIDYKKKKVLEIKTKQHFFNLNLSERNTNQALAYMNMYDCETCLFVQYGPNGKCIETNIEYEPQVFDFILYNINEFCSFARELTEHEYKDLLYKSKILYKKILFIFNA